ncbi:MAG: S8 family serine peptidase, partial [Bacteroidales bacterium]|nr:S8 family serine peptidase [Bacteroidales bacterium]
MKKNHIILFLALVLSTLTFGQNFNAIEPELQKILNQKSEELIDVQIYFKSSIDSKQLNQATRKAYTKAEKKELVVNELKTYSENVQADVMNILRAEELSGEVSDIHNLWIASSISCKASASVIYQLSSHPDVKMIGYDKEFQLITPEQMEEIKSAAKSDVRAGGPDAHVQAVEAHRVWWEEGYTGKNVIVAVLDSGTNTNHLDLKDHLWTGYIDTNKDGTPDTYVNGWNFISDNSNITDDYGHGTHCAGIVCGDGTAIVTTGIAPDASLMTVKTINRTGGGSVAQMLKGVQFAVENGADVLSMSLGFKNNQLTTTQKEEIRAAFDNVLAANVVVCAAAGNDGDTYGAPNNVDYPAACPAPWRNPDQTLEGGVSSVICVGAHDLNESSRGPSTWEGTSYNDYPYNEGASMGLIRPDISAPGYIIRSTKYSQNDIYELKSGTSQATPCVAGVIALMLEKNSSLTPAQISQIIEETATSKPETKNNRVGAGVVNALAAVNSITEVVGNPFIQVSTFAPQVISTGKQTIGITLNNTGNGASEENTSVTLSLSNDPYITIANPTQNLGRIGANSNKTLFFELDVDAQTPSGHTATFSVNTTSGSLSWDNAFSINITSIPEITFQSVSPAVVKTNTSTDINVTIANTGTAAFSDSIKLKLVTISNDLKHVTLVDNETSIKPLG